MLDGRAETLRFLEDNANEDPEVAAFMAAQGKKPQPPEIDEHLQIYWQAWLDLKNDRHYDGMGGATPILYQALSQYARDFDIVGDDLKRFVRLMRAMDNEYLSWLAEQSQHRENRRHDRPPEITQGRR